jgi:GxxExxY protein
MLCEELSGMVIGVAMEVNKPLGPGFLESVYEHALELTARQIMYKRQAPIAVLCKQMQVGEYRADFLIDGKIVSEIKATSALIAEHHTQVLHYLTAKGLRLALLFNFGARSLQLKRIIHQGFLSAKSVGSVAFLV